MRRLIVMFAILGLVALPVAKTSQPAKAAGWINFQLGDNNHVGVGETCPNSNPNPPGCTNNQGEPLIRSDRSGTFYGASENGLGGGTEAWRSSDNGQHYTHLASPNAASTAAGAIPHEAVSPAGGDVDLATAPQRNAVGNFNVYVASLTGASVTVSTSANQGATWQTNFASSIPLNDREWIAADGSSKVCISYINAAGIKLYAPGIRVDCSYDAGKTFLQHSDAIDADHAQARAGFAHGNLVIDPRNHYVYQIFSSQFLADAINPNPTGNHVVYMGVSKDGGNTFKDYVVYANPDATADYGHQFPNVSVDRAGNVYAVYSDNHNVYYSYSTDHGQTWHGSYKINTGTGGQQTAIFPWSVAGNNGKIDVVFYGANYYDGHTPPDNYPCNDPTHCGTPQTPGGPTAEWNVFFAENLSATTPETVWATQQVTSVPNHYGGVCEGGFACMGDRHGNRDLFDDFGIAVSPTTNAASIIYDSDRYFEYNHYSRCTPDQDNNGPCTHTNIATGVSNIFTTRNGGGGGGTGVGDGGCDRSASSNKVESDLLLSINQHRLAAGLPTVKADTTSSDQAREHACTNAGTGKSSDVEPDGSTHADRMSAMGVPFTVSGENVSSVVPSTTTTIGSLLDGTLMADPLASGNILNPSFTTVGIGAVDVGGTTWVSEDFNG